MNYADRIKGSNAKAQVYRHHLMLAMIVNKSEPTLQQSARHRGVG